jgi:hypothetical protein
VCIGVSMKTKCKHPVREIAIRTEENCE